MRIFFLSAIVAGGLFGFGVVLSGMTDPERVIGFLDIFGDFNSSLAFVLGGAVLVTLSSFRLIMRMHKPFLATRFEIPRTSSIDRQLLGGAAIFGLGWGIAGYCPGPAIAGLAVGSSEALWFVGSMLLGSAIYGTLHARKHGRPPAPSTAIPS